MKSVLIVDDSPLFREAMAMVLEREGYFVATACSVDQAIQTICRCHFDVVISDYDMPQKSGLELLRHLRHQALEIPFIMVSASDDVCVEPEALLLGAFRFIAKPFRRLDLVGAVSLAIAAATKGHWNHPDANTQQSDEAA